MLFGGWSHCNFCSKMRKFLVFVVETLVLVGNGTEMTGNDRS